MDAGRCNRKICQKNTSFMRGADTMSQDCSAIFEDVVRHLSGRDASLRRCVHLMVRGGSRAFGHDGRPFAPSI